MFARIAAGSSAQWLMESVDIHDKCQSHRSKMAHVYTYALYAVALWCHTSKQHGAVLRTMLDLMQALL